MLSVEATSSLASWVSEQDEARIAEPVRGRQAELAGLLGGNESSEDQAALESQVEEILH